MKKRQGSGLSMTSKQKILVAILAFIIILLVVILILEFRKNEKAPPSFSLPPENIFVPGGESTVTAPRDWEETEFRKAAPVDVRVPEVGETVPPELQDVVAVPAHVVQTNQGMDTNLRVFYIRAEGNRFIPEQIIAKQRDTVHIQFTAVDKDYDFTLAGYNMMQRAQKGETKIIEFQAISEGRFLYFCEACGGPESPAKGEVIIVK